MPSINAVINLTDRMTGPMMNIISSVNNLINATERVGTSMDSAFDTGMIDSARRSADLAERQMQEISESARSASQNQQQYNRQVVSGTTATSGLLNNVKNLVGAYIGIRGVRALVSMSDQYAQINARLGLITDNAAELVQLQDEIFASANRARAAYTDTASAVSRLAILAGNAFKNTREIVGFTELMNKNFVIGGAAATEQAAAMYQLTQAMASGRLQGDEYRSIIENAPLLASAIKDYMTNVEHAQGTMKDWAAQGLLTANVIKAALFSTADEVNERFERMPMTWGQVWKLMGNYAQRAMQPVLTAINWLANNINIIIPLVLGIGTAFTVFQIAAHWTQIAAFATAVYHGAVTVLSIAFGILTGNTAAASAAVFTFNSALLASPITWIIIIVLILIAIIYAVVAAINKAKGTTISATGIIVGALYVFAGVVENIFLFITNTLAIFGNFFGNFMKNPIAAVETLFLDLARNVLRYIGIMAEGIENLINKIPGVQVDITSGLAGLTNYISRKSQSINSKNGFEDIFRMDEYANLSAMASKGYTKGLGFEDTIKGWFSPNGSNTDTFDWSSFNDMQDSLNNIDGTTKDISDEVTTSDENMEYLRKMAERDIVMRYVTPTINVDMSGMSNTVNNDMDIDGVIDHMVRKTSEAMSVMAEG